MTAAGNGVRRWSWPAAVPVGAFAFACSCLMAAPGTATHSFGNEFAAMAAEPFACRGPFPHRILGPLVAWALGFGREHYWLFAHATVVVFLTLVAGTALRYRCSLLGATLLTATIAVTGAVEVYKGHVGYSEPATFSLLLGGALLTRHTHWFWFVQFLGLLNHEGIAFYWPWLVWRKLQDNGGIQRADWLGAPLAVGAYLLVRWQLLAHATQPTLAANVYFASMPTLATTGMWACAMVAAVVYFGLLPALLAWHAKAAGWRAAGLPLLFVLLAILVMCTFATDVPRFVGFLALPTVFAGIHLLQHPRGSVWLFGFGAATAIAIVLQRPLVLYLVKALEHRLPEPFPALLVDEWPLFAGYGGALALMIGLGRVAARPGGGADSGP